MSKTVNLCKLHAKVVGKEGGTYECNRSDLDTNGNLLLYRVFPNNKEQLYIWKFIAAGYWTSCTILDMEIETTIIPEILKPGFDGH